MLREYTINRKRKYATIEEAILAALPAYQWRATATLMHFAHSIGYSETPVRAALKKLVCEGRVACEHTGSVKGKPRYTWVVAMDGEPVRHDSATWILPVDSGGLVTDSQQPQTQI